MKKKSWALIMVLLFGIVILAACGKGDIKEPLQDEKESSSTPDVKNEEPAEKSPKIVLENEAFKIYEPAPNSNVKDRIVVRGLARVWEATVLYEFEDGHYVYDEGFTTASEGAPGWGEFEIVIELDKLNIDENISARVILFEESAEDGSRQNELQIPVNVIKE